MSIKIKGKPTIVEVLKRSILSEGRNSNMGFAFLKKIKKDYYETVNPISSCKDYLSEVTFTETTGIGTKGCGLVYMDKLDIFKDEYVYMVITIQQSMGGGYNYKIKNSFEEDIINLKEKYKDIQELLNKFESQLEFKNKTIIEEANDNQYLVSLPIEWTISTISISLYTLLLRSGQVYDGKQEIVDFMSNYTHLLDKGLITSALSRVKIILENKRLPKQPTQHIEQAKKGVGFSPHSFGICSWDSKYEEVKELKLETNKLEKV